MRLAVLGATGRVGARFVDRALAHGHEVRALSRSPVEDDDRGVAWVEGSVLDASAVANVTARAAAVIVAIGPDADSPTDLCSKATAVVLSACKGYRIDRLLVVTGAMIGHTPLQMAWLLRAMSTTHDLIRPQAAVDRREQERLVMASQLEWTLVRPPRLVDGDETQGRVVGPDVFVPARGQATTGDVAAALLEAVEGPRWVRQGVVVLSNS